MAVTRRQLLGSAAVAGAAAATGLVDSPAAAAPGPSGVAAEYPEVVVRPDDPRYAELVTRGYNRRFTGTPEQVQLVYTPEHVQRALERAVRNGKRVTVRSGGHCFDGLVDDPRFQVLLDVSEMKRVYYDPGLKAFAVESGATVYDMFKTLYLGWGVTVPAGVCPTVGVGGHVCGGGYGPLSRREGLTVDHLYAVEVVVVDGDGRAHTVVATREPDDPHRDLWWAHTGGGGGNFGIVTKYFFRSPGASGTIPGRLLPRPPARLLSSWVNWSWEGMTEADFSRLVANHAAWHTANSEPGTPYASLHSSLHLNRVAVGALMLEIRMDATLPNAARLFDEYIAAVSAGVSVQPMAFSWEGLWLENSTDLGWVDPTGSERGKTKGGNMRKPFTESQVHTIYRALTDPANQGQGKVYVAAYGGQINTVSPTATAVAQRDSLFKVAYSAQWADPAEDAAQLAWIRALYRDVHAATGGVPVTNESQDGCYINYPDVDLKDPAWNTSGVPWSTLYYKQNYRKLQRVKATYDPRHVFRHALSVEPAA
jgi:aclacinomycin oxidase